MSTTTEDKKISDMSVYEFKTLIRDTIYEIIDPDYGLELRTEVEEGLKKSLKQKANGEGMSLEEAKNKLGL
ncbi:MAG: hypothetical protein A3I04_01035 [Nitrospinae bacterium RIFCSPLOWO2_02_FULL_39_110]|nr:MAG: hypothetical protein A2W53_08410 [Nitrospinae bacterium RIFCSPHIGHO2_02_39_11]OGV98424.1 MAG: hypothetical protein A3D97_05720 [Nitrospinae bacterium RIFCSPHIGHO2_12_FULL_39_42]OGV99718.1 MAG: hypothetical protein A3D20_03030 [Nitrospinae bacterium RIFCSPHIGHO2_02_FULL_39_82]OGW05409.1 MAG: hypothetical protein A2Z59_03720 [Nitrospinae bacterium RIFCSPLOWO2_02_39_17]OGW07350.1 MAG: hypothetical protein A3I04_01035 [Nitrospinae bacterium RIFCSPLOWO2_02_FULL_39_110]OGW08119.1 MAG: hypoth